MTSRNLLNLHEDNRVPQKRQSSPFSDQALKKKAIFNGTMTVGHLNEEILDSAREVFNTALIKQMELVQKLVFKDNECQKLKRKFDEVDRNCRKWHDFAIGLQSRVKRLALILHRQQDSMKNLRNKEVCTATVATQTTFEHTDCLGISDEKPNSSKEDHRCSNNSCSTQQRSELRSDDNSAVVIDLTSEESLAAVHKTIYGITPQSVKQVDLKSSHARIHPTHRSQSIDLGNVLHQASSHIRNPRAANLSAMTVNNTGMPFSAISSMDVTYTNFHVRPTHHVMPVTTTTNKFMNIAKNGMNLPYPPLPPTPSVQKQSSLSPPKPLLKIRKSKDGIELSWDHLRPGCQIEMESYELFVYQYNLSATASGRWKKIGNDSIKAMPLPMACTLSQFSTGSKYYFAVRGIDICGRYSVFSDPCCSADV